MRCSAAAQLNLSASSEAAVTPVAVCTAVFTNLRRSIIMASSSSWLYGENYTRGVGGRKNAGQCLKVIHHGGHGGTQGKTGSRPNFLRLRRFFFFVFFSFTWIPEDCCRRKKCRRRRWRGCRPDFCRLHCRLHPRV